MPSNYDSGIKQVEVIDDVVPYVYEVVLDDIQLSAAEERGAIHNVAGYQNVYIMAVGEAATFDVNSYASPNASDLMPVELIVSAVAAGTVQGKVTKLGPALYLTIKNTSASAAKFSLWIYAV